MCASPVVLVGRHVPDEGPCPVVSKASGLGVCSGKGPYNRCQICPSRPEFPPSPPRDAVSDAAPLSLFRDIKRSVLNPRYSFSLEPGRRGQHDDPSEESSPAAFRSAPESAVGEHSYHSPLVPRRRALARA